MEIIHLLDLETRARKIALSSNAFLKENNLNKSELAERMLFYDAHRSYWKKRKISSELYFNYEVFLFLYYKWMKNFELDKDNSISLILDIMNMTDYYGKNYFDIDRLSKERIVLITEMKVSSGALLDLGKNGENIMGASFNNNVQNKEKFIREINAHIS